MNFEPIGILKTCFKEKFGIPRQAGLVKSATGVLKLNDHPFYKNALKGLDQFSHVWVLFVFHKNSSKNWKPSIRPPRLGGAKKIGVFASRSPHRPNPIGISVLRLENIHWDAPGGVEVEFSGVDILDNTPILDIKPYLPYADSIPDAKAGWASEPIQRTPVEFSKKALDQIQGLENEFPKLKQMITEILELDPRPAFQKKQITFLTEEAKSARFAFLFLNWDVKWMIQDDSFLVLELEEV